VPPAHCKYVTMQLAELH